MSERLLVNRAQLARMLSCSVRLVSQLEADGVIVAAERGRGGRGSRFDAFVAVPAYLNRAVSNPATAAIQARERKDRASAEHMEMKIAEAREELLPRDQVIADGQAYTKGWAAKVRSLPRIARQTGVLLDAHQEAGLAALCRQLLTEIAGWRTRADAAKASKGAAA